MAEDSEVDFQPDLFSQPPNPPSGPPAVPYFKPDGFPSAFWRFLDSEEGAEFWLSLEFYAMDALRRRERFSALGFIHEYRAGRKIRVNNSFAPWLADLLLARHPDLECVMERRKRRKPGPFEGGRHG